MNDRLFDLPDPNALPPHARPRVTGALLRDEGLRTVTEVEDLHGDWMERARAWIESLPPGETFTSEDLRAAVGPPVRVNAPGAAVRSAAMAGLIVKSGRWRKATRAAAHATDLPEWERATS